MSELMWIRSHVEQLLEREWDACRVQADDDGDWAFRRGTAAGWVSVLESEPVMVRVFAHAVHGVKPSYKLLKELMSIQRRCVSCRIDYDHGVVMVSQTVSPWGLTQPVLAQAITIVGSVADDIGSLTAMSFGGDTPYAPEPADVDEEAS